MFDKSKLHRPRFVAVWPGMGNVAVNAGVYLLAKLSMNVIGEIDAGGLFDVDHVEVKDGVVQVPKRPQNRFFLWSDPDERHDLVVFLGEAQPPSGKYAFCRQLVGMAQEMGAERIFTFAAMATQMHPEHRSRVFAAVSDEKLLAELKQFELEILQDGHIGGLNGVLLGAAAESGLPSVCLLGEMPHIFSRLPYPKASLAVLETFRRMTNLELDLSELSEQARTVDEQLGALLEQVQQAYRHEQPPEEESFAAESVEEERLAPADQERIEKLFEQAARDRSKAFELKQELDRLAVFKDYEDRFLDLFKKSE